MSAGRQLTWRTREGDGETIAGSNNNEENDVTSLDLLFLRSGLFMVSRNCVSLCNNESLQYSVCLKVILILCNYNSMITSFKVI